MPDWSFVDTSARYRERSEEAPAGVGERGSNLDREEVATEIARVT